MEAASKPHAPAGAEDAPTRQLVAGTIGDRCTNCGSPMAPDQRYCVNCGERRGRARFPVPGSAGVAAPAPPPPPVPVRPRFGASSAFVAGIGVLLLAMGVGVLIGSLAGGNTTTQAGKAAPIVVHVNGGGGSSNTGSSGNSGSSGSSGSSSKGKKGSKSASGGKPVKITKVVQQKAAAAATKVLGGSKKLAAPTASVGSSCTPGTAGCSSSGKFTGNFFGNS